MHDKGSAVCTDLDLYLLVESSTATMSAPDIVIIARAKLHLGKYFSVVDGVVMAACLANVVLSWRKVKRHKILVCILVSQPQISRRMIVGLSVLSNPEKLAADDGHSL